MSDASSRGTIYHQGVSAAGSLLCCYLLHYDTNPATVVTDFKAVLGSDEKGSGWASYLTKLQHLGAVVGDLESRRTLTATRDPERGAANIPAPATLRLNPDAVPGIGGYPHAAKILEAIRATSPEDHSIIARRIVEMSNRTPKQLATQDAHSHMVQAHLHYLLVEHAEFAWYWGAKKGLPPSTWGVLWRDGTETPTQFQEAESVQVPFLLDYGKFCSFWDGETLPPKRVHEVYIGAIFYLAESYVSGTAWRSGVPFCLPSVIHGLAYGPTGERVLTPAVGFKLKLAKTSRKNPESEEAVTKKSENL